MCEATKASTKEPAAEMQNDKIEAYKTKSTTKLRKAVLRRKISCSTQKSIPWNRKLEEIQHTIDLTEISVIVLNVV